MSLLLKIVAFVLVLLAVLVMAAKISGIDPQVFAWGGVAAFILSFIVS